MSPRDASSGLATGVVIDVNPELPIDPLSLSFTDSNGNEFVIDTLGYSWGASQTGSFSFMRNGQSYEVGVDSCGTAPSRQLSIKLTDVIISSLHDDDNDGRFSGVLVFDESGSIPFEDFTQIGASLAQAETLELEVLSNGTNRSFSILLSDTATGTVLDAASAEPVADAEITALSADDILWPSAALAAENPQTSGADGSYRFGDAIAASQLVVQRSGYQSYRSWTILQGSSLNQLLKLTPELSGAADHTIYITENGFVPSVLSVAPGSVVEWINLDLNEHTASSASFDSGALAPGERYRTIVGAAINYDDAANPLNGGSILIDGGNAGLTLYLPLIVR